MGKDKLMVIKKKFQNNLSLNHEGRFSVSPGSIGYVDIKENSLTKGRVTITPTIYFEFSVKDSVLQKVLFCFISDNKVEDKELPEIIGFVSSKLPVLNEYKKSGQTNYQLDNLQIKVVAKNEDNGFEMKVSISKVQQDQ